MVQVSPEANKIGFEQESDNLNWTRAFSHSLSNLKQLDLTSNQLTQVADGAFSGLKHLQVLNLRSNKLNSLPNIALSNLTQLRKVDLKNNQISNLTIDDLETNYTLSVNVALSVQKSLRFFVDIVQHFFE